MPVVCSRSIRLTTSMRDCTSRKSGTIRRINPQTGYIEVGIPLSVVDKTWTAGQIGAIVRTYRPDLLPA